ncbi:MAG: hypothetical protein Q4G68_09465 [Planctomycetia bacterium]|nr:hypothetical protein [Planctomycetia bacterium]
MIDSIPRCTRICCKTRRPIKPGELFYSMLVADKGQYKRLDYSAEAWQEPKVGDEAVGWWESKISLQGDRKIKLAPNDILLNLFDELLDEPEKANILYVLTLLMIRRRIFRYEREGEEPESDHLLVYALRRETTYTIPVVAMTEEEMNEVQEYLASLLYSIG